MTCKSCHHSIDNGQALFCQLKNIPAVAVCKMFVYEPGTDEEAMMREKFKRRIRVDKATGCWLWQKSCDEHGIPHIRAHGRSMSARRYAYQLFHGVVLLRNQFTACSCDDQLCVNPRHTKLVDKAGYMQMARDRGVLPGYHSPIARAKLTAARRARAKLTWPTAREIRMRTRDESDAAIAPDFNIHKTTVGKIRRNEIWIEQGGLASMVAQYRASI